MAVLLLLIGAGLTLYGYNADSGTARTIGWICWAVGMLLLVRGYLTRRRKFRSMAEVEAAAAAGDPRGMYTLGALAKVRGDLDEAERQLRAAADAGHVEAMWDMGRLVEDRDGLAASEPWFRMAAEHGHFVAKRFFRPGSALNMDGKNPL
ncbi:hypothetical protein DMB66_31885 [Actinoplanes sp. ATCC 53533]|uniref:sel1 repeat family protein n=1 Tax=Actinoplanes sp. ATCC 53533 TaxID=1288362 RepID=UPI000F773361|nr:sel1 repeat family protein [Actinoplanes sp. ATCC 53533]RSM57739.1 hypothetical protein DMB66_31885 [Actinoplanes sp. ATCC 53533]